MRDRLWYRSAVDAPIPASVAALASGVDDLDAFALDARLRATRDAMHRVYWQTGRLLRLVFDLRLYRWLGFETGARYVRERLGISIRTAQRLIAVERVTARSPRLAAAYERGAISWLRALTIAPVLSETHEASWLARANEVTLRRLSDEVGCALSVQDIRPLCEPAPPPAGPLVMPSDAQMRARFDHETPDVVITLCAPVSRRGALSQRARRVHVPRRAAGAHDADRRSLHAVSRWDACTPSRTTVTRT